MVDPDDNTKKQLQLSSRLRQTPAEIFCDGGKTSLQKIQRQVLKKIQQNVF